MRGHSTKQTRRTILYIMGPSYSGSTLLTRLLAAHPRVSTIGELKASAFHDIQTYRCSCGAPIRRCRFWRLVEWVMKARGRAFGIGEFGTHFTASGVASRLLIASGVRGPLFEAARRIGLAVLPWCRRELLSIVEQNRLLIETLCAVHRKDVFLDASKSPTRLLHMMRSGLWKMKVIYLIRDGRGVTDSIMRHHGVSMTTACREWLRVHRQCERMYRRVPPADRMRIHYEELCTNTPRVLDEICRLCGIEAGLLDGGRHATGSHILGNPMRLRNVEAIRVDEKWRHGLETEQLLTFAELAGRINSAYGYFSGLS